MSTKEVLLARTAKLIDEVVDFSKVKTIPVVPGFRTTFEHDGVEYGILVEPIGEEDLDIFPPATRKVFEKQYGPEFKELYNFGFDREGTNDRVKKYGAKELIFPLAVIVGSLIEWIEKRKPGLVTIIAAGGDQEEISKKISLYGSLLRRESDTLKRLGYTWDSFIGNKVGKSIYIRKVENN